MVHFRSLSSEEGNRQTWAGAGEQELEKKKVRAVRDENGERRGISMSPGWSGIFEPIPLIKERKKLNVMTESALSFKFVLRE